MTMNRVAIVRVVAVLTLGVVALLPVPQSFAGEPGISGGAGDDDVFLQGFTTASGSSAEDSGHAGQDAWATPTDGNTTNVLRSYSYVQSRYEPLCRSTAGAGGSDGCIEVRSCPSAAPQFAEFTRTVTVSDGSESAGLWSFTGWSCRTVGAVATSGEPGAPTGAAPPPRVTWQMVLREVERMGLPSLEVQIQPSDRTLVNFETNFYAEPEAFEREVTLLGQDVDVRADPVAYDWTYGDGATEQTESPGAPYPDLQVTHTYEDADVTVRPSVAVTYEAEFRVGDGDWEPIPETVTISGPPVELEVVEATPVLSGNGHER
jgi:hypothetical protein